MSRDFVVISYTFHNEEFRGFFKYQFALIVKCVRVRTGEPDLTAVKIQKYELYVLIQNVYNFGDSDA